MIASSDCGNGLLPDSLFEHLWKEDVEAKVLYSLLDVVVPSEGVAEGVEELAEDVGAVDA